MRSYEEISNRIMQRGDEIIASRKVRAAKIRQTSYAVSGICAAVITGVGIWRLRASIPEPDDGFNNSNIISTTEPDTENMPVTAQPVTTTNKTTTVTASTVTATGTASVTTTAVQTPVVTTSSTTLAVPPATTAEPVIASETTTASPQTTTSLIEVTETTTSAASVTTTKQGAAVITVSSTSTYSVSGTVTTTKSAGWEVTTTKAANVIKPIETTTTIFKVVFTEATATTKWRTSSYYTYQKENVLFGKDKLGEYIDKFYIQINPENELPFVVEMDGFEIIGTSTNEAIAVKLPDTEDYYLFRNIGYKKEEDIS